jgi:peptidyl-prolyl cis-trans isomerase C
LTDDRRDDAAPGADDTPAPDNDRFDEQNAGPDDGRAAAVYDQADEPDAAEEESDGRRRPPLAVIIGAALLLVAVGVGLGFLIPSGPVREADQLVPTSDPAAAPIGGEVPTALPLPAVVEGDPAEVIAQVGAGQILRGDFVRFYQPGSDPAELLDQLIQRELVVQQGFKEGVTVDEAVVDEQLEQIKQTQAGGDPIQFQAFLDQAKIGTEENLRRLLGHDQIIDQMIIKHTTAEQVRARHILLSTENISDTAQLEAEAEGLMKQLDEGADFAALATERSDDPGSAVNGGDLGWALRGLFVPEFDEAVFTMEPGERRLVQTQFGYHIIEVVEPAAMRNIESTDLIQTPGGQQAFAETFIPWAEKLKTDAEAAQEIKILVPAEQLVSAPTQ